MAGAQSANAFRERILDTEPFAPSVGKAARGTFIHASSAKTAFFRTPSLFECDRNFCFFAAVGYADSRFVVYFFASSKTSAAKYAKVVVFIYKRIVALYFINRIQQRKVYVASKAAHSNSAQFAPGPVGTSAAARGNSSLSGSGFFYFAIFPRIAAKTRRRMPAHHKLYRAAALRLQLLCICAHHHSFGGGRRARCRCAADSVNFHNAKPASPIGRKLVMGAERRYKKPRALGRLQNRHSLFRLNHYSVNRKFKTAHKFIFSILRRNGSSGSTRRKICILTRR